MATKKQNMMFVGGAVAVVCGVVMILSWWPDVVSFFKGFLGMAVAIGGLVMMHEKNGQ